MKKREAFLENELAEFEPTEKIGLIATVNDEGLPHISLITSLQAKDTTHMIWGQFTEGQSKHNVRNNPDTSFLILTMAKKMWRGRAKFTHFKKEGEEFEMFNNKPMFRYNSYFGIHTVYYMDLLETYGEESLPLHYIVPAAMLTKAAKGGAKTGVDNRILKPFAEKLFNGMDTLKFISYINEDGFPTLTPVIQCQSADSRRLVFSALAYGKELKAIPEGAKVALFGLNFQMENCLVRGNFLGFDRYRGVKLGSVDIDWVYNSMPPKQGIIYPREPLSAVTEF